MTNNKTVSEEERDFRDFRGGVQRMRQVEDLAVRLEAREAQLAAREDRRARALERLNSGIDQAYAPLVAEYQKDIEQVLVCAQELRAAVERLTGRYRAFEVLRWEAQALAEHFGLPRSTLPFSRIPPPVHLPEAAAVAREVAHAELPDRSYPSIREIDRRVRETPGGQLMAEEA